MALPEAYQREIQALNLQVLHTQPSDILQFCADYFATRVVNQRPASRAPVGNTNPDITSSSPPIWNAMAGPFTSPFGDNSNPFGNNTASNNLMHRVIEEEENDTIASPTDRHFGNGSASLFSGPFGGGGDASADAPLHPRSPPNPDSYPAQYNFARRTSVSAESLKPSADTYDNWTPPYHEKSPEQLGRLQRAIEGNFLFSHLEDEQSAQILGALVEKPIPAKGIKVISQGDAGDYFYVVEKGSFDVHVNSTGSLQPGVDGMGDKVGNIQAGGSFGELALMYNAPRAATVVSAESGCTVWALDRVTFRRILMESTFARRRMYESFLEEVPILATITPYERSKIADALETKKFAPGELIIKEGDPGHSFYLLSSGEADAYKGDPSNKVLHYSKGDFFGELALLNDAPRAASVVAASDVKVASLGKNAFQRLLGPVEGILRRTKYQGVKSGVEEMDPLHAG
ncbi:cyclic nucleotide-binding-like protein [Dactylonectria estremocensis]|uniref:cAMP-dependent protein kinase regulatory subunit n=1 Tax=Dactylonectria estremocensis TaxID=1079267 RepID=A0A9P9J9S5_9HYPO|nr:cyclic nucleotide-binding-like protein [Dactylonectria estremocensis]